VESVISRICPQQKSMQEDFVTDVVILQYDYMLLIVHMCCSTPWIPDVESKRTVSTS
jgi:hypothetical protein